MTEDKKTAKCPACGTEWHIDMRMVKERVIICPNCKRVDFVEYFVDRERTLKKEKRPVTSKVYSKESSDKEEKSSTAEVISSPKTRRVKKNREPSFSFTSDCFIATATYGTESYEKLSVFYRLRDEFLLKKTWGRALTRLYYQVGPCLARLIRGSETLRRVSRVLLDRVAVLIQKRL